MANLSAWRVNDVVAYEVLQEVASTLIARLLVVARAGGDGTSAAREELAQIRSEVLAVNGYDRRAVESLTARLRARLRDLAGAAT